MRKKLKINKVHCLQLWQKEVMSELQTVDSILFLFSSLFFNFNFILNIRLGFSVKSHDMTQCHKGTQWKDPEEMTLYNMLYIYWP